MRALFFCMGVLTCSLLYSWKSVKIADMKENLSIAEIQELYKSGQLRMPDLVQYYLTRISQIDQNGPQLKSIIAINPEAMEIAAKLQEEYDNGQIRGPLHGIPVVLKDNIDTADQMPCTAGSLALANSFPKEDSWMVKQLRQGGAIILAKANLSEWANFRSNVSSSGWSALGGQTKNPYVLDRNPCGSSAGSGAAVAADLCTIAFGTETNGSIVCPSNNNGLVGLKPTVGLISRSGIVPISFTQDTPGPMCRNVEDVALSLGVLVSSDRNDSLTSVPGREVLRDYTKALNKDGLKGKRIGRGNFARGFHHRVEGLMEQAVKDMEAQGATIIDFEEGFDRSMNQASFEVMLFEFKDGLNKYLAGLPESVKVRSLADLITFNKEHPAELRYFDQALLEMAEAKGDLNSPEYKEALKKMKELSTKEGLDLMLRKHKLDAIIAPTGSPAWKTDLINGDLYMGGSSSPCAISGYPNITVPMGQIDGLPVGISFMGPAWSEARLIEIAYAYEQATGHWAKPNYRLRVE